MTDRVGTVALSRGPEILISIAFAVLAIDMGGQIGLRNIVLPTCLLLLVVRGISLPRKNIILFFFLFVVYPAFLLMLGIARDSDVGLAFSQYQSTLLAFVLWVVLSSYSHLPLEKILFRALAFTALLAIVLAILLILSFPGVEEWIAYLHDKSAGYFGVFSVAGVEIVNIYFKSTLFFVPAALYFLLMRRFVLYFICLLGLVVAVSKTGVFFVVFIGVICLVKMGGALSKFSLISVFALVVAVVFSTPIAELFFEVVEGRSETVDVRVRHLGSVLNLFSESLLSFLFGSGLGVGFYSEGAGEYITNFEIDHLNTIRKYGLLWFFVFFCMVFRMSYKCICSHVVDDRVVGFCLLICFVVAGTNPVLLSPIFFSLLVVVSIRAERCFESPASEEGGRKYSHLD